jgi:Spy/CpxP family protein refolding chaperone
MTRYIAYANLLLLVINLSALGTIVVKGQIGSSEPEETTSSMDQTLALSPQQIQRIQAERQAFHDNWGRIDGEIQATREELLTALQGDDATPVWPLIDELAQLQAELEKSAVTQLFQEKDILTPQQQKQYFTQVETRMREGCGCMRGYRGGRGDGFGQGGRGGGKGWGKGRRRGQ